MIRILLVTFFIPLFALGQKVDSIPEIELINPTFLGNETRNYYGNALPDTLEVKWKTYLGFGKTTISRKAGSKTWHGSGWTGQPLMVLENKHPYIIQGCYDHNLKKFDALTGDSIWGYDMGDVIKGTGTIYIDTSEANPEHRALILQGSRLGEGKYLDNPTIHSYRAISLLTGKEVWRHNCRQTHSYSRDVDGSALIINDTAYIGLENSYFTVFDPSAKNRIEAGDIYKPHVTKQILLYNKEDRKRHRGNLVTESSPSRIGNHVYVASGTGHVYGYNINTHQIDWDFFIGSDIDGSAVVTKDSCLLISVEKQYIDGHGGVFKLNPKLPADSSCVQWYLPTGDCDFAGWKGGIIGSCSTNDQTNIFMVGRKIGAVNSLDGNLYVFEYDNINLDSGKVNGPNNTHKYYQPKVLFKYNIKRSISTPIIIGNRILSCGYNGCYLFEFDYDYNFKLLAHYEMGEVESTPFSYYGNIYIGSRNGYLYCLGRKEK